MEGNNLRQFQPMRSVIIVVAFALSLVALPLSHPSKAFADVTPSCYPQSHAFNWGNLPNSYGNMVVTMTFNYEVYNVTSDGSGYHWACGINGIQNIGYANINHEGLVRGDLYSCAGPNGPCAQGDGNGDQNYYGLPGYGLPYKPNPQNGASYWSGGYYGVNVTGSIANFQPCWSGNEMFQPSGSNNQYFIYSNVGGGNGIWCAPIEIGRL